MRPKDPAWLEFYRYRLMRREMRLLAVYRTQGRRPRISLGAYWRASFIPLVLGLVFFGARAAYGAIGVDGTVAQGTAVFAAAMLLLGLVLADVQLFVTNSPAWAFAKKAVNWSAVAQKLNQLSPKPDGTGWDLNEVAPVTAWDRIEVPPSFLNVAAKSYRQMAKTPPSLNQTLVQGREIQALGLLGLLLLITFLLFPGFASAGLPLILFFAAFPAKNLKARLDFWVTWPELQQIFDWKAINRMAGRL